MCSDFFFFPHLKYSFSFCIVLISCGECVFITAVHSSLVSVSRYTPTSQLRTQEDAKEWLRSHSAGGLQDTAANSPFSSGSSVTSPSGTRFNFSQLGE